MTCNQSVVIGKIKYIKNILDYKNNQSLITEVK